MFRLFENLVDPFPRTHEGRPPESILRFCLHYSRGLMLPLLAMTTLSTLIAVFEVSLFGFLGQLVDWLGDRTPETLLENEWPTLAWFAAIVLLVLPLLVLLQSLVIHQTLMGNFPMIVRWQGHRYLMRQSLAFFQDEFAGRVSTKLMQTALAVRETVMKLMDILVYVGVYFISIIVLLGSADLRMSMPLLAWLAAYIAVLRIFVPRLKTVSERQADARSMMTGRIVDSYANIVTVKLFSHARREASYAREGMQQFLDTVHPQMRLVTGLYASVWSINAMLIASTTALSVYLWMQQAVSTGVIAIAIALCLRLNGVSQWIMWEVSSLFENIGTVRDGINTLSNPIAVVDAPGAGQLEAERGDIEFRNVHFDYGAQQPVFDNLNMHIRPGERVGLVGRSGAGKSTLVNLLLRFYDIQSGEILVDGQNISSVTQESLRAHIGVVTQDTSLLHRSIRENISYGRPDADEAQIIAAARRAEAWDFIKRASDSKGRSGLDAHVGERGVKLSGGQRQRIAIARVMLKDAPILILDEATSALDSEVELAIQDSLGLLMQDKTVIAIAHRLSTIAAMDRLLVIDNGRIVEQGTHQELVASGGIYSQLWAHQSGGFIATDIARAAS